MIVASPLAVLSGALCLASPVFADVRVGDPSDFSTPPQHIECFVLAQFKWDQSSSGSMHSTEHISKSWNEMNDIIGELLAEMFNEGGYLEDPLSFPVYGASGVSDVSGEQHYLIFDMREDCDTSISLVQEVFSKYRERLIPEQIRDAPTVNIRPATKYQALCGLNATLENCPDADRQYPD